MAEEGSYNLDLPSGQDWLIDKMSNLGYLDVGEGICFGVASMAMQAFLSDDLDNFNNRLLVISRLKKAELDALAPKDPHNNFRNYSRLDIEVGGCDISFPLWDMQAFFDGISLYQSPGVYEGIPLVVNQLLRDAEKYVIPTKLETERFKPKLVTGICGAYDEKSLVSFLSKLQGHIMVPVALILNSSNHVINVNYNPYSKEWSLIDANDLSCQKYQSLNEFAKAIILAFTFNSLEKVREVVLNTSFFTNENRSYELKQNISEVCDSNVWGSLNKQVARIEDSSGANLLYIAAKSGYADVVQKLLDNGAKIDITTEFGATPLSVAVIEGHLNVVSELLDKGADFTLTCHDKTPKHFAKIFGHKDIVDLISRHEGLMEKAKLIFAEQTENIIKHSSFLHSKNNTELKTKLFNILNNYSKRKIRTLFILKKYIHSLEKYDKSKIFSPLIKRIDDLELKENKNDSSKKPKL